MAISAIACAENLRAELEKRTNGAIAAQVYPNSSLMKTVAQFSAVRKGALDLSLYPISYAGGEFAELNIGLMPGLVSSYRPGRGLEDPQLSARSSAPSSPRKASSSCPGFGRPAASPAALRPSSTRKMQGPEDTWWQP